MHFFVLLSGFTICCMTFAIFTEEMLFYFILRSTDFYFIIQTFYVLLLWKTLLKFLLELIKNLMDLRPTLKILLPIKIFKTQSSQKANSKRRYKNWLRYTTLTILKININAIDALFFKLFCNIFDIGIGSIKKAFIWLDSFSAKMWSF